MKKASRHHMKMVIPMIVLAAAMVVGASVVHADPPGLAVNGRADIRVWVDRANDVFPSYQDVVVSFRPVRDCYATLFVVDTDGYMHVVYPLSPRARTWVRGGVTYRYSAFDLGLDRLYGRGIAYIFAVGSPRPFDYSPWGEAIFVGHYGYRVYGDPFVASHELCVSLLPTRFNVALVGVGVARFYVGEWVRYPSYLCHGHGGAHVRVGDYCRSCARVYDGYRIHVASPGEVFKQKDFASDGNFRSRIRATDASVRDTMVRRKRVSANRTTSVQTTPRTKVVSTSRTVSESREAYKTKYRASAERVGSDVALNRVRSAAKVIAKQQRVSQSGTTATRPTTSRAPKGKSDSKREEGKQKKSATGKAR